MGFVEAVTSVLANYATFSGRASRSEFWWWTLAVFIVAVALGLTLSAVVSPLLGFAVFSQDPANPVNFIIQLALLLPNLSVLVRRLHDTGRSGWWFLIGFIPLIGLLILLLFLIGRTEPRTNRFGPPPRHAVAAQW